MNCDPMTRPARIWLHAAVMRRTLSLRRSGRMNTIRFHGAGILRAIFCDWNWKALANWLLAAGIVLFVWIFLTVVFIIGGAR